MPPPHCFKIMIWVLCMLTLANSASFQLGTPQTAACIFFSTSLKSDIKTLQATDWSEKTTSAHSEQSCHLVTVTHCSLLSYYTALPCFITLETSQHWTVWSGKIRTCYQKQVVKLSWYHVVENTISESWVFWWIWRRIIADHQCVCDTGPASGDKSLPACSQHTWNGSAGGGDKLTAVLTHCSDKAELNQHSTLSACPIWETALTGSVESLHAKLHTAYITLHIPDVSPALLRLHSLSRPCLLFSFSPHFFLHQALLKCCSFPSLISITLSQKGRSKQNSNNNNIRKHAFTHTTVGGW